MKTNIALFIDDQKMQKQGAAFNILSNNIKVMFPNVHIVGGGTSGIKRRPDEVIGTSAMIDLGYALQNRSRSYENLVVIHENNMVRQQMRPTEDGRRLVETYLLNLNADNMGFVSTFYLKEPEELLIERVTKLTLHEIGHIVGATHCSNKKCVMNIQNKGAEEIIASLDENTLYFLCDPCKKSVYG